MARRQKIKKPDMWGQYKAAERRVGYDAQSRAEWLLQFRGLDLPKIPEEGQEGVRWDAFSFTHPLERTEIIAMGWGEDDLPSWDDVRKAQRAFWVMLGVFRRGHNYYLKLGSWKAVMSVKDRPIRGQPLTWELPFRDAFLIRVYLDLTEFGNKGGRLRFCERKSCGRPFLAKAKHKMHCSESCARAERTKRWRQKNREKFREYRKQLYAKKIKATLGAKVTPQRSHAKDRA